MTKTQPQPQTQTPAFLQGGGDMGARIRAYEWTETPLGAPADWPPALQTATSIMLNAATPLAIYWGSDLTLLYNDAWRELIGNKHPAALGRPARAVFPEIWDQIAPLFARVMTGEGGVVIRQQRLLLQRNNHAEETWFDYSLNPVLLANGADAAGTVGGVLNIPTEVTARQRMENELRASERRYRILAAHFPGGAAFLLDRDLRYLLAEGEALEVAGFTPAHFEGRTIWEALDPETVEKYEPLFRQALMGQPFRYEHTSHGRHYVSHGAPLRDDAGEVSHVLVVSYDITARKRAERRAANLARFPAENPNPVLRVRANGTLLYANPASAPILEEWGVQVGERVPPPWPERITRALSQEEVHTLDAEVQGRIFSFGIAPIAGAGYANLYVHDVTRRRRAAEALRESEATLSAVLESLPVGVVIADEKGAITRVNAANNALWGIPPETRSWQEYAQWEGYWPETGERIQAHEWAMTRALLEGEVTIGELVEYQPFDGRSRRFYLNNAAPVYDDQGNLIGGVVVELDVTEQRKAQRALADAQRRLQAALSSGHIATWVWDLEADRVYSDGQTTSFFNLADDGDGLPLEAYISAIHPHDRARVTAQIERAIETGEEYQAEYRIGSGEPLRWVHARGRVEYAAAGEPLRFSGVLMDVTARRQAEIALRESRERLRLAKEAAGLGIHDYDIASGELCWDERMREMWGIGPDEPVTYDTFFSGIHPDDRAAIQSAIDAALGMGGPGQYHGEYRIVDRQSGDLRWIAARATVFFDNSHPVRVIGTAQDITARKEAQDSLRRYAERLRVLHQLDEAILTARSMQEMAQAAVEHAPHFLPCLRASVALYNPETRQAELLAVQSQIESERGPGWRGDVDTAWGPVLEQLQQGRRYVIADVQTSPISSPLLAQLRAEGVRAQVYEPLLTHGELLGTLLLGMREPGPLPQEQLEVIHELAVQLAIGLEQARLHQEVQTYAQGLELLVQQRTAALKASETRFRTVFEEAALGIALTTPEGEMVATNPALRRMFGYTEEELVGMDFFSLLPGVDGGSAEISEQALLDSLLEGARSEYALELEYTHKSGETGVANVVISTLRQENGESPLLLALVEDITERRQAQRALVQAEQLTLLGRMAAALAHEINNPIQSVVGCLGLAQELKAQGEDVDEFMDVAITELRRAADIVHNMRDLSRHEQGEHIWQPTDVLYLIERVILLTRKQARDQGVEVTWEDDPELPPIPLVADRIQQVFLNMTLNAIDAMPEGGDLHITVARAMQPAGEETGAAPRPGVLISFADTGVGIPPGDVARLFEAFHSTKESGLGLGLYVSRIIVSEHGGYIDVESVIGEGTTFTVWLPEEPPTP